jgi:DNA-binding FrmR family transcriptional regulator
MSSRIPADPGSAVIRVGDAAGDAGSGAPAASQSRTNEITALLAQILTGLVQTQDAVSRDVSAVEIVEQLTLIEERGHRAGLLVLEGHLRECLTHTGRHREQPDDEMLIELQGAIRRFILSLH